MRSLCQLTLTEKILLVLTVIWLNFFLGASVVYGLPELPEDIVGKGGAAQGQFESNNGIYSTWQEPNTTFKVEDDYSFRLNNTANTQFLKLGSEDRDKGQAQWPSEDLSAFYVFNTKDNAKGAVGYSGTNFSIYNPALGSYDKVDIKVTFTDWKSHDRDDTGKEQFVCVTHSSARPSVKMINLKWVEMKIEYYKTGTTQPYNLKSNVTFEDIDNLQSISFDHNANHIQKHYTAEDSILNYGYTAGQSTYYCPIIGNEPNGNPRFAMGFTFNTNSFTVTFGNNYWNNGNLAYFGMYGYDMVKKDVPLPTKTVSDHDETSVIENTIENPDDGFTYEIKQEIPTGMSPALYYKEFEMQDKIDSCLQIMDIRVLRNTTDVSKDFDITKENNVVKAAAKPNILQDREFYGGVDAEGGNYRLQIKVRINKSVSAEQLQSEGHFNQNKTNLTFENTGSVKIDGSSKNSNMVKTVLELPTTDKGDPGLNITKTVKRFEWQVKDKAQYTIKASHSNKKAQPDVIIKDIDLEPGLVVDMSTVKVSGTDDFMVDKANGGFQVLIKRLAAEKTVTVTFEAAIEKSVNGREVDNTAVASSWNVPDKQDTATIYVNSPKNHILKKTARDGYKPGDTIAYQLDVTQSNSGCFMRDIIINDSIKTEGVVLRKGSIQVLDTKGDVITEQCSININQNQFEIKTKRMLVKGVNPYKYTAEEKLTVTYEGEIVDNSLAGKTILNVASAPTRPNTNGDLIRNDPDIPSGEAVTEHRIGTGKAVLDIEKKSDKNRYQVGENAQYELTVKQIREDAAADHVIIKDQFDREGVSLKPELINVIYNKQDISSNCKIKITSKGFEIDTNVSLKYGESITVKYIAGMVSESLGDINLKNQCSAQADNGDEVQDECTVEIIRPKMHIEKTVEEKVNQVGGIGTYTLTVSETEKHVTAHNVKIWDQFQIPGVQYDVSSIIIYLEERDITNKCQVKAVDNGTLTVVTNKDLSYGQEMRVVYDAKYADQSLLGQDVKNVAGASADKTNESRDDATVTMKGPKVILKKTADKDFVTAGDNILYTVTAEQIRSDVKAKDLVLSDTFQSQWIEIDKNSFQVKYEDQDITKECNITVADGSFTIKTGVDLGEHEQLVITYSGKLKDNANEIESIKNIAILTGGNIPDTKAENTVWIENKFAYLEVKKQSDKEIYSSHEKIVYTVKTKALGKKTAKNAIVCDKPETGRLAIDCKSVTVFDPVGKDITAQCKVSESNNLLIVKTGQNLEQGQMLTLRYTANITDKAAEGNYIYNTVEAKADNTPKAFDKASVTMKIGIPDKNGQVEGKPVQTGDVDNKFIAICTCLLLASIIILVGIIRKKGNMKR